MRLSLGEHELDLDPSGALYWQRHRLAVVADLHFEKASAFARRGSFLPPYDTEVTLSRLEALVIRLRPSTVISLGDGFHDRCGPHAMSPGLLDRLGALVASVRWIWITGNHDPVIPLALGGACVDELIVDGMRFAHQPSGGRHEVAGHLHPKARVSGRRVRLSRPCFVADDVRMVMPAFGCLAGGLNACDPAVAGLFPRGFAAYLLGDARVFRIPHDKLVPEPSSLRHLLEPR